MVLEAKNLSVFNKDTPLIQNISLKISSGEFHCLCGPNGCGKSTLMTFLSGLNSTSLRKQGEVLLDNFPLDELKSLERAKKTAFLIQSETCIWPYTVRDFVLMGRWCHTRYGIFSKVDYEEADFAIEKLGIKNLSHRYVNTLSGGEFQKARIARCLVQKAPFIFMDEPGAALDIVGQENLLSLVSQLAVQENVGILVSVHDILAAERNCSKIILLPKLGQCIQGENEEVLSRDNLEKVYGKSLLWDKLNF